MPLSGANATWRSTISQHIICTSKQRFGIFRSLILLRPVTVALSPSLNQIHLVGISGGCASVCERAQCAAISVISVHAAHVVVFWLEQPEALMKMNMIWRGLEDFRGVVDDEGFFGGIWGEILRSFYFFRSQRRFASRCIAFLPRLLGAQLCAPFSIPLLISLPFFMCFFFFFFWNLSRSRIHLTCVWALIHCLPPFSRRWIPLRRVAALSMRYSSIFYFATYHHSSKLYGRNCSMGQCMDVIYYLLVWFLIFTILFGLRECFPFLIPILLFSFFGDFYFLVSGSALRHIASLEGVSWNIWRLCERAQCAAISVISGHAFLIVFFFFCIFRCRPYLSFLAFILQSILVVYM